MGKSEEPAHNKDGPEGAKNRAVMLVFMRSYFTFRDFQEALQIIERQAGLLWDKTYVARLKRLQLDLKALENTFVKSSKILSSLLEKLCNTKPYLQAAELYGDGKKQSIDFTHWRTKDKIIVLSSLVAALVVLAMGAANVYSNIMGSGNPAFIESPILALIIAMLLPAGSLAMKFVVDTFESDQTKARYIKTLNVLTVIVLLTWTVLFALTFDGQSEGIDLDAMLEANPASSALTWIQLVAELLVGFVLTQTAADNYAKYAPNVYVSNPEYLEIKATLEEHSQSHEALREEINERSGGIAELEASRQIFMNEMVALFINMRRRFDDSSPE